MSGDDAMPGAAPEPYLFIGGHRKSGTTMVHELFDGHPGLLCYPHDLTLLYAYYPDFSARESSADALRRRLTQVTVDDVAQTSPFPVDKRFAIWRERFNAALPAEADLKDMAKIIRALTGSYAASFPPDGRPQLTVVKETSIEIYADEILEDWFPGSLFLHLARDPRDNFAALRAGVEKYYSKMGEDEAQTLFSLIHRLGLGLRMGLLNSERFGEARYRVLRFEDLTAEPEAEMRKIADWIGVEFHQAMLTPTRWGRSSRGNNFDGKAFVGVSGQNVGAWRERIAEEQAKIIEFHLGDLMEEYGYHRAFAAQDCRAAASNFYKWTNYRYFYSDRFSVTDL